MKRTDCRGCGGTDLVPLLDLGEMPLAGGFWSSAEQISHERRYPLSTHLCARCGLVQILDVIDPSILFGDYSFSSSTIASLVEHFEEYALWLKEQLRPQAVVEFGCNDGVLLAALGRIGISAHGVDASPNITEIARARGLDVTTGYFDPALARELCDRVCQVDIVTGSNVFSHNDRPELLLEAAGGSAREFDGRIVFTSTCSVCGAQHDLLTEDSPTRRLSVDAATKLAAENELAGKNALIFRLGPCTGWVTASHGSSWISS